MKSFLFSILFLFLVTTASAQEAFLGSNPVFRRSDLNLGGRLRQLTLEDVAPGGGKEVVILLREGNYPDWKLKLSVWEISKGKPTLFGEVWLPEDVIFYSFLRPELVTNSSLFLVRSGRAELWGCARSEHGVTWQADKKFALAIDSPFFIPQLGNAEPLDPTLDVPGSEEKQILLPARDGFQLVAIKAKGFEVEQKFPVSPRAFHKTATERMQLELPYWLRSSAWYPGFFLGTLTGARPADSLFFPWMDEVAMTPLSGGSAPQTYYFHQLSEEERDDGQSYALAIPSDLNNDGRTDFVVTKFQGETTSLRADTEVFMTGSDGKIPEKGVHLAPRGNRAAGALPIDLDRSGKKTLVVASSTFNAWAVVKALIQRTTDVNFAFYSLHPDGYHLDKPDYEREISFRFDLFDLFIDGMLPTLEGDFNGDGYPDALYARDRKGITVLLQNPKAKEPFPSVPSAVYEVPVSRLWRVGDLDGDGKSDIVLYDRRSAGNRKVTVLMNAGKMR
ncbi:MAG: VCBS repeat-containing protein [Pseudomonadota bacterium]